MELQILRSILNAQASFIAHKESDEIFSHLLEEIVSITQSQFGFIGEIIQKDGKKNLKIQAFSKTVFESQSDASFLATMPKQMIFERLENLFGYAINSNEPIISNDPKNEPFSKGTPKGHPLLSTFLGIPINYSEKQIGFVGVANAQSYPKDIVHILQPLFGTIGHLLEAKNNLKRLEFSEERYRIFVEYSSDFLFLKDTSGRYCIVNQNLADFFQKPIAEVIGKRDSELMEKNFAKMCELSDQRVINSNQKIISEEIIGDKILETTKFPIKFHGELVVGGVIRDITDYKKTKDELYHLAFYDNLTRLPNRKLFFDFLNNALDSSEKTKLFGALVLLDLDHFKHLNDSKGHKAGDELLGKVADLLKEISTENITLSRFGGDEFAILIEDIDANQSISADVVENFCETLLSSFSQPFSLLQNNLLYSTTPSLGVTLFYDHSSNSEILIKQAEIALYKSKELGRNRITFFDPAMQTQVDEKISIDHGIRDAIEKKSFELFYQPQTHYDGTLVGFEALLRWKENDKYIAPSRFIPFAEETGLIFPLGNLVIEMACNQIQQWQTHPHLCNIPIAINVSVKQFFEKNFLKNILSICKKHNVPHHLLKIEITESVLVDNIETAIYKVETLKSLSFQISLDDFGTGYSSLSYLKRLQPNQLKIDRSFIHDILEDEEDYAIVEAIIAMGQKLGIEILAEGIESKHQLVALVKNGCKVFQGFLFSKPLRTQECEQLFINSKRIII